MTSSTTSQTGGLPFKLNQMFPSWAKYMPKYTCGRIAAFKVSCYMKILDELEAKNSAKTAAFIP